MKWKPWEKSSGPKTPEGKAKVSQNAYKGGMRPELRALARTLRESQKVISELAKYGVARTRAGVVSVK